MSSEYFAKGQEVIDQQKENCWKSEDGRGVVCFYCFHGKKHPDDWKYWKVKK